MIRFPVGAAVAAFAVLALVPSASHAGVRIIETDAGGDEATVVSFPSAKCKKASKKRATLKLTATAKRGGYTLRVNGAANSPLN